MSHLLSLLFSFYGISIVIANPIAIIFIIYSGIQLIVSAGNKEKVQKAKKTLTYAIIGLILIYLSFPILHTIGDLTGTTCLLVGLSC
jgi:hypothetical protein